MHLPISPTNEHYLAVHDIVLPTPLRVSRACCSHAECHAENGVNIMAEETNSVSPPYATYKQFINFLNGLRETTVPQRIDRSVFGPMSGGTAYSLLSALKFLKLIDDSGAPQSFFRKLVDADDFERKALIAEMLETAYPSFFGGELDLSQASSGQFDDHIREQYKSKGSTIDKQALFFLNAAEDAGITLSAHLKARRPTAASPASRKRQSARKEAAAGNTPTPAVTPRTEARRSLSHVLTDLLDVNDMTDVEMEAVWTLLRYQKRKEAAQVASATTPKE